MSCQKGGSFYTVKPTVNIDKSSKSTTNKRKYR